MLRNIMLGLAASLALTGFSRSIDLSGTWEVRLGPDRKAYHIDLPGTTDLAGIGEPNKLKPELAKPQLLRLTRKHRYVGPATYVREFTVPSDMAGKPLEIKLERVMWRSRVSVDSVRVGGMQESLTTPHRFYLPDGLSAGKHLISIDIDNSKMYEISGGELAHAYTDDTQIKWNGVLGDMELREISNVDIFDFQIYPDVDDSRVRIKARVDNHTGRQRKSDIVIEIAGPDGNAVKKKLKVALGPGANFVETECDMPGKPHLWSEFAPELYTARISAGKESLSEVEFGMRKIEGHDGQILVNGNPTFLRGTLECCVFPLTGTPPLDEDGWDRVFDTAEEWGLNHLRFHSWCPPEAAFAVADRRGFYLHVELPLWSTSLEYGGSGAVKDFIKSEYDRIITEYGNHPSFVMLTVGNELQSDFAWLNEMTAYMKNKDDRHLYAASSFTFEGGHGGHAEPYDDFMISQWTDDGWVRGPGVFDKEPPSFDKDYSSSMGCVKVPLVTHEIGQYAVYPDLKEIDKYTGVLDPLNFKAIREDLKSKGRLDRAEDYLKASGSLAAILYKEEMERAMKTKGIAGIQLLGLSDFPGQGTALVGLVNAFGESKGVAEPEWFRQFSSPVVPLARFAKATYRAGEQFVAEIETANYKSTFAHPLTAEWCVSDTEGKEIDSGYLDMDSLPTGLTSVGRINVSLASIDKPSKLILDVKINDAGAHNSWPIWVYPEQSVEEDSNVLVTASLPEALSALEKGKNVLLSPVTDSINGIESKFVPVFWSPVHFPNQAGGMGVTCRADHPALGGFPNDGHSDWQWWHAVKNSKTFNMDSIPGAESIVEVVDNFTSNRPLALVAEAKCGNGKLVLSAIDIVSDRALSEPSIVALRNSLVKYIGSEEFIPNETLSSENLSRIIRF